MQEGKMVVWYLKGTIDHGILFNKPNGQKDKWLVFMT